MRNEMNFNDALCIVYLIQDSPIPDANPVKPLMSRQFGLPHAGAEPLPAIE